MRKPDRPKSSMIFRCAIYTRKSSDDGLEQEWEVPVTAVSVRIGRRSVPR